MLGDDPTLLIKSNPVNKTNLPEKQSANKNFSWPFGAFLTFLKVYKKFGVSDFIVPTEEEGLQQKLQLR